MENSIIEDLYKAMDAHIERHPNPKRGMKQLQQLLEAEPDIRKVTQLLPIDEMEARLDYIQEIERGQRITQGKPGWTFTPSQYAMFMNLPLQTLEDQAQQSEEDIDFASISKFLVHFFQRAQSGEGPEISQAGSSKAPGLLVSKPSSASKSISWKRSAKGADVSSHKRVCSETAVSKLKLLESPTGRFSQHASAVKPEQKASASPTSGLPKISLPPSISDTQKGRMAYRSKATRKLAGEYDKDCCVVTGLSNPQGCHILPFTWNSTEEQFGTAKSVTGAIINYFGPDDLRRVTDLCSGLGCSDKDWNMICLSPQLHTWWSRAYFGLKYLGHKDDKESGMSTAELQFVWMPYPHYDKSTTRIDLNEEKQEAGNIRVCLKHMFGDEPPCLPHCNRCTAISKVQAHKVREHYTIESGYVFPVVRKTKDIEKFKAMIQIQWAAICVGSMSGAAMYPELLVGDDDDDSDEVASVGKRIEDWLESVQRSEDEEKAAVTPSASPS